MNSHSATPLPQPNGLVSPVIAKQRRARIASSLPNSTLVVYGGHLRTRSNDTEFPFRPDSDFYYLTGLAEAGSVLVYRPGHSPEKTLFVQPRDPQMERWAGRRIGPKGAQEQLGVDQAFDIAALDEELPKLLDGTSYVYVDLQHEETPILAHVRKATEHLRRRSRTGTTAPVGWVDSDKVMAAERLTKDEAARSALAHAVNISAHAHIAAMKHTAPGRFEYEVEALLNYHFRASGGTGPGYGSIVGGGDNATVLHYIENNDELKDGDLVLIDAGGEWDHQFTGDITRTFPVSGKFSEAQRELYEIVLAANEAGIRNAVVGNNLNAIHDECVRIITEGLCKLGLLEGAPATAIENKTYEKFYMHRTSHWLGVDVHDVGSYTVDGDPRPLEDGFAVTIEPGIYISRDEQSVPEKYRGIGIRIEDDVLVTSQGPQVLSHAAPKTVAGIEAIVGTHGDIFAAFPPPGQQ